jgi:hypothetical protein
MPRNKLGTSCLKKLIKTMDYLILDLAVFLLSTVPLVVDEFLDP